MVYIDIKTDNCLHEGITLSENNKNTSLGERIQQKMNELDITQEQLADMVGISQNSISKIIRGVTQRSKSTPRIAKALGVSEIWLVYGDQVPTTNEVFPIPNTDTINTYNNAGGLVPVISWVAAGSFSNIEALPADELVKWVPCPVPHGPSTFALKVVGISMENPNGKPSFEDGDIIYIDPERCPENKSFVIVTLDGSSQATFKQLIIELDGKYIQPLNPNWHEKIIKINGNATINGVVIGKWTDI